MTKSEFLKAAIDAVRSDAPAFGWTHQEPRDKYAAIGRDVAGKVFVYLDLGARTDNWIVGHGVGWAPSRDRYLATRARRENPPIQAYDGSLRRPLGLERPRDFDYDEARRSTGTLFKPFTGFDLAKEAPAVVIEAIRAEIRDFALPYLSLMLRHRFAMEMSAETLATDAETCGNDPLPGARQ